MAITVSSHCNHKRQYPKTEVRDLIIGWVLYNINDACSLDLLYALIIPLHCKFMPIAQKYCYLKSIKKKGKFRKRSKKRSTVLISIY